MLKFAVALCLLCFFSASPTQAEKASLAEISSYLDQHKVLAAQFVQISYDGSRADGQIFLKRPGRLRFEYQHPNNTIALVAEKRITIFDYKSNSHPSSYPVSNSPLLLLLSEEIDFTKGSMVLDHSYDGSLTNLVLKNPEYQEFGQITLKFEQGPLRLSQWQVTNQVGEHILVVLSDLKYDVILDDTLFNISFNIEKWKKR
ncbi:MAG: outer membrane lipoprotein carrier protein LolA [Tateyamaria sp.]|jgi:outer membrane lipoprotein-sorting protein|nr:outer membrane lipoprotein carrier protein LolA [Tateyamaria sp.]MDG1094318.1 outer membrane lipoprotein carrier protein LolA [Paracoccaceae bacterium]|tara:strand:- start:361 stop:963 length:603 start_codon:yes stop_codon:yes gene_type:complete